LTLSRPMERVTSSSIVGSLEKIGGSVVNEPTDFTLYLGWYLTAFHQWENLNSDPPVIFLYNFFTVSRTMASTPFYLQKAF
jgi:hypothetical protein